MSVDACANNETALAQLNIRQLMTFESRRIFAPQVLSKHLKLAPHPRHKMHFASKLYTCFYVWTTTIAI